MKRLLKQNNSEEQLEIRSYEGK